MKEFKLVSPKELQLTERMLSQRGENEIKIKITKTFVDSMSLSIYNGSAGQTGIVPLSRNAALVSDPGQNTGFCRGERVHIDPYIPCGNCYECKTDKAGLCPNLKVMGKNADGFLTEFKIASAKNLTVLPDSVTDENAMFIEDTALAISVMDMLPFSKGEYIVIFGSDILSNILCQLAIYHQLIPILVDCNEINVETARRYGVYYIITNDAQASAQIKQITGGRMVENLIYLSRSQMSTKHIADCCANGARVVFCGEMTGNFINYHTAYKKQVQINFVNNAYGNIPSAINALVNKAVKTDKYISESLPFDRASDAYRIQAEKDKNKILMTGIAIDI